MVDKRVYVVFVIVYIENHINVIVAVDFPLSVISEEEFAGLAHKVKSEHVRAVIASAKVKIVFKDIIIVHVDQQSRWIAEVILKCCERSLIYGYDLVPRSVFCPDDSPSRLQCPIASSPSWQLVHQDARRVIPYIYRQFAVKNIILAYWNSQVELSCIARNIYITVFSEVGGIRGLYHVC